MLATLVYIVLFALTLSGGLGVLFAKRPDHAAFSLMAAMFGIAAHFLFMGMEFLAFIQVIVYVGAILVLFLFVIMLLNMRRAEPLLIARLTPAQAFGAGASVLLLALILPTALYSDQTTLPAMQANVKAFSPVAAQEIVRDMMTVWLFPFLLMALLLTAAVIAAVMIARSRNLINIMIDSDGDGMPEVIGSGIGITGEGGQSAGTSHHTH